MTPDTPTDTILIAAGLAVLLAAALSLAAPTHPPEERGLAHPGPFCTEECAPDIFPALSTEDCALLAIARIAQHDGARVGRGHWRLAAVVGEVSASCFEAQALVALTRQESTWNSRAVSELGACGISQVRSCDAPGTFDVPCCDGYRMGGHHCRPTCEALMDTRTALLWTRDWLRDRDGWHPEAYFGAPGTEASRAYAERAEEWLAIAQGR